MITPDERSFLVRLITGMTIDENGCWNWNRFTNKLGYSGNMIDDKKNLTRAYRASNVFFNGEMPEGYHTDHLCKNHRCINPDHLETVTPLVNSQRGGGIARINALKTHCPKGHKYDADNTRIVKIGRWGRGTRQCVICVRALARANYLRKRAQALNLPV